MYENNVRMIHTLTEEMIINMRKIQIKNYFYTFMVSYKRGFFFFTFSRYDVRTLIYYYVYSL